MLDEYDSDKMRIMQPLWPHFAWAAEQIRAAASTRPSNESMSNGSGSLTWGMSAWNRAL